MEPATTVPSTPAQFLSKVPEITVYFWVIKVLCTTVGETAADFLNVNLNFGLTGTSIVTGILLAIALFFQFKAKKYVPGIYWLAVVLISVFGTLVTDNLTDAIGVPLEASTIFFSIALAVTFLIWYGSEKTLSIHSIVTRRREAFYWLAILFTFALGTAAGDLFAEQLGVGYFFTGLITAGLIALLAVAWRAGLGAVLSFWLIYILTRPLGASLGDFLSQPQKYGGLGLGPTVTSAVFLLAIAVTVTYLALTRRDVVTRVLDREGTNRQGSFARVVITIAVFIALLGGGYALRQSALQSEQEAAPVATSTPIASMSPLGDLSSFRTITQDTLTLVEAGKLSDATARVADLEHAWDVAEPKLRPKDKDAWNKIDSAIDKVLQELRAPSPDAAKCDAALQALLDVLD